MYIKTVQESLKIDPAGVVCNINLAQKRTKSEKNMNNYIDSVYALEYGSVH